MVETLSIIATSLGVDCTMGCLLDFAYFKEYYKFIAIDLSKKKYLMPIQKQYNKSVLLGIEYGCSFVAKHRFIG